MKIELVNLGVIQKAEIELKPLTVFIGENNTGKTWTSYTLASILGGYGVSQYLKAYLKGEATQAYPPIDNAIAQILAEGNAQVDIVQFARDYAELYINDVARLAPNWMPEFMATERVNFQDLQIKISLAASKDRVLQKLEHTFFEQQLSVSPQSGNALLSASKEENESILYFYTLSESKGSILQKLPERVIKKFVSTIIFVEIHGHLYSSGMYLFPTERTTFITFPFSHSEFNEFKKSREKASEELQQTKIQKKSSPIMGGESLKSFINMIFRSYSRDWTDREKEIKENPEISTYIELAKLLERDIIQGNVDFEDSGLGKELLFQASDSVKLQMPVVSSMVKELTPLVLCLRYWVAPDEWLIIDEPEMNLHPAAQVEMIEFLAMLVAANLNVLITTHSPYIVDHLVNLMQAAKHEDKERIKDNFYLERTEAFIPQDKVSVYLFEEGTAKNILDEAGRINWQTFANVSDDIANIFL